MNVVSAPEMEVELQGRLVRYVPILGWIRSTIAGGLLPDALAGLSVWALLVPQSLAYATHRGRSGSSTGCTRPSPPFSSIRFFGTSKQLVGGAERNGGSRLGGRRLLLSSAHPRLARTRRRSTRLHWRWRSAVVDLALGLLRMGWISTFLSKAVVSGFVLGFAIGIIINQAPKLFGVPGIDGSYMQQLWGLIEELPDTSGATLAVGAASLGLLLLMRYTTPKLPRALIVVVLSIAAVRVFDLADEGVAVTGDVPTGLFSIGFPDIGWSDAGELMIGALAVVFVGYSETLAAARTVARKRGYEIDTNQELTAQGVANGAAGLVGGFVVDGSLSKTSVADDAGQKTEVASIVNAVFVLATLLFLAALFEDLPARRSARSSSMRWSASSRSVP